MLLLYAQSRRRALFLRLALRVCHPVRLLMDLRVGMSVSASLSVLRLSLSVVLLRFALLRGLLVLSLHAPRAAVPAGTRAHACGPTTVAARRSRVARGPRARQFQQAPRVLLFRMRPLLRVIRPILYVLCVPNIVVVNAVCCSPCRDHGDVWRLVGLFAQQRHLAVHGLLAQRTHAQARLLGLARGAIARPNSVSVGVVHAGVLFLEGAQSVGALLARHAQRAQPPLSSAVLARHALRF